MAVILSGIMIAIVVGKHLRKGESPALPERIGDSAAPEPGAGSKLDRRNRVDMKLAEITALDGRVDNLRHGSTTPCLHLCAETV
jgi:hypothetical protein